MTTRADFAFGAPDRLRMACQVVARHYAKGRQLLVYSSDTRVLGRFDRMLWSFDPASFVPHVGMNDELAAQTPVLLASQAIESWPGPSGPALSAVWLLNLDPNGPPNPEKFERILEIVSNEESDRQAARQRWIHYKAAGLSLHAHDVSGNAGET
jgi:DNA polymerase-3 subunit chi